MFMAFFAFLKAIIDQFIANGMADIENERRERSDLRIAGRDDDDDQRKKATKTKAE